MPTSYTFAWILPFVRQSLRGRSSFSYEQFVWGLWPELERAGVPGVERVPPNRNLSGQVYDYANAPSELKTVTGEAFYYLFRNGFTLPEPPQSLPGQPSKATYHLTKRGLEWAASIDPLPEDVENYMRVLRGMVVHLDAVIEQYILESLRSFERQMYFAAAVMIGAAAEKSVYLLAESMLNAHRDATKQQKLNELIERRTLSKLFHAIESTLHDSHTAKVLPHSIFDGAVSHLMSLFEAIRVQRNDAVHPMNATVSADSVRLSLYAFPHALEKLETMRAWFVANPKCI